MADRRGLLVMVVATAVVTAGSQLSQAQEARFGVVRVANKLDGDMTLYYRWGHWEQGKWKKETIEPGKVHRFVHEYSGAGNTSPTFYCRFDTERDGGRDYWEYTLSRGASPDEKDTRYGHRFEAVYVNDRKEYAQLKARTEGAVAKVVNKNATKPAVDD